MPQFCTHRRPTLHYLYRSILSNFTELNENFVRLSPLAVRQSGSGRTHGEVVGQVAHHLAWAGKDLGNPRGVAAKQDVLAQIVRGVARLTGVTDTVVIQVQAYLGFLKLTANGGAGGHRRIQPQTLNVATQAVAMNGQ